MVFAMLKQIVSTNFDERMIIAVPDPDSIDLVWERNQKERPPFERVVVNTLRELAKLNPPSHVHAGSYTQLSILCAAVHPAQCWRYLLLGRGLPMSVIYIFVTLSLMTRIDSGGKRNWLK